mmetsp:Transcript_37609/g.52231  ORF Transcript_37609/g.52231 Transcript_37609/m.52231 type:complete len:149 (-) Transcript_37609:144-590(-)
MQTMFYSFFCPAAFRAVEELTASLGETAHLCKLISIGCAAAGGACLVFASARAVLRRRRNAKIKREALVARQAWEARIAEQSSGRHGLVEPTPGTSAEERVCAVCWMEPISAVFKGCGHLCCCVNCAKKLRQCPICRKPSEAIRVYTA